ncbi:MAG: GNAT family N-acetyltransferase [Acidobacteria bacterium]|nr:GNAT family N-acetyltransferase [Acidobacteriota bacterium]
MGILTDRERIRERLQADPIWSVYALGDLQPGLFSKCQWFEPDLTLLFRGFDTCILFAIGQASVPEALSKAEWPLYLQVQAPALAAVEQLAAVTRKTQMWRMVWSGDRSGWVPGQKARRLTSDDVPALERLYADGAAANESPDFFFPEMVEAGVFYGVCNDDEILAAAGTHLYSPDEGVVAIGNVYTRRDVRGSGFGKLVTCAVLGALAGLPTVALNVRQDNAAAIQVYESLGFLKHCAFFEGLAAGPLVATLSPSGAS